MSFALTEYKLQGRTLARLVLSGCQRHSLVGLYVLLSRVRTAKEGKDGKPSNAC